VYAPIPISDSLNPEAYLKEYIPDFLTSSNIDLIIDSDKIVVPSLKDITLYTHDIPSIPSDVPLPPSTPLPSISISKTVDLGDLGVNNYFISAMIEKGYFKINIYDKAGNSAGNQFTIDLNDFTINQTSKNIYGSPYDDGLDLSINSLNQSLAEKSINGESISISGTIDITYQGGEFEGGTLEITLDIEKISKMYWDISEITELMDGTDSVSLKPVAQYLNWISFNKCDYDKQEGLFINMHFDSIIPGLKMTIKCNELPSNSELPFNDTPKDLVPGSNVFGNSEALKLQLVPSAEDPDPVEDLKFVITLSSSNTNNPKVLLINGEDLEKTPLISGYAKLYPNWESANVNMKKVLNAAKQDSEFEGKFPAKENIDLSMLNEYLEGFRISGIKAAAYLSGPDKTINGNELLNAAELSVSIGALYSQGNKNIPIIKPQEIKLTEESLNINKYLVNGSYISDELPATSGEIKFEDNFEEIINDMPKDLAFQYKITIPDAITVTQKMFVNVEDAAHEITATIMLLMRLELKAGGEGAVDLTGGGRGGRIIFPDMFNDQKDLFGREAPGEIPLDVSYIRFTIDFTDTFFTGGKLFIEDKSSMLLFPDGIDLNGRKITVKITNNQFDIIGDNLITPDFRLEFKEGGEITIPRNIGVTSVRIEGKGKNSLNLEF